MKRLLTVFAAMMLTASCALAQSELPKLYLKDIEDQSKIVYDNIFDEATYESGSEKDNTYLLAYYNDHGELDEYLFTYDCGCAQCTTWATD